MKLLELSEPGGLKVDVWCSTRLTVRQTKGKIFYKPSASVNGSSHGSGYDLDLLRYRESSSYREECTLVVFPPPSFLIKEAVSGLNTTARIRILRSKYYITSTEIVRTVKKSFG
jgi:hypothetical protein